MATSPGLKRGLLMCAMLTLLTLPAIVGCNRVDDAALCTENRLRAISAAYLDFAAARGQGPPSAAELRAHLEKSVAAKLTLQQLEVENSPALFVSERDAAPFILNFGEPISMNQSASAAPIALEARGRDGTHYVAFANGKVECVETESLRPIVGAIAASEWSP